MRLRISSMNVCVYVCVLSSSGGVQFCSATYRLFKVAPSEQCRDKDKIMEVQYKGRWEGRGGDGRLRVGGRGGWMHGRGGEERDERGEVREGEGREGEELFVGAMYIYELTLGVHQYVTHFVWVTVWLYFGLSCVCS